MGQVPPDAGDMTGGMFITLEGGEGSGKSTQIALLESVLAQAGIACVRTREPGGSPGAERIRALLVNGDAEAWDPLSETLLFYAARADHVQRLIKPALAQGKVVICDRFADSTFVYQGVGKQIPEEKIRALHTLTLGDFAPDLTLILDIDPTIGLKRAGERRGGEARFESMEIAFHEKVRTGFLAIAKKEPQRCVVIDAALDKKDIHHQIVEIINQKGNFSIQACSSR